MNDHLPLVLASDFGPVKAARGFLMPKLPVTRAYDHGNDYTAVGQADADLASARDALEDALRRSDLTAAQRRDLTAALKWARQAARAIGRHVDYGDDA